MLTQLVVNGLTAGGVYALLAVGYTLIYGVARIINFSHGDLAVLGAFAFLAASATGLPFPVALAAALVASAGGALLVERLAYRPVRQSSRLAPLITTIGAGVVIQAILALEFGFESHSLRDGAVSSAIQLGGATTTALQIGSLVAALGLTAILQVFLRRSFLGRAIRALADDPDLAVALGVNEVRVVQAVFALSGVFAAVAGVLLGMQIGVEPSMGFGASFRGFTAAVLGGIGSVPGALLGGLLIGLLENVAGGYLPAQYQGTLVFVVLIAALLLRPQGILGEAERV
jgi:branched-chain amino acid transport system permease protein